PAKAVTQVLFLESSAAWDSPIGACLLAARHDRFRPTAEISFRIAVGCAELYECSHTERERRGAVRFGKDGVLRGQGDETLVRDDRAQPTGPYGRHAADALVAGPLHCGCRCPC